MSSNDGLLQELLAFVVGSFGTGGVVVLVLFLFPEKVEKWGVMLWRLIYFLSHKGEKRIVAHDIQGRVNDFAKSLKKEIHNFEPVGIGIQWVTEGETQAEFFKEERLIIRMRQHADQNRNFVYASMAFISRALLTKAKRHLSQTQAESVDLYVGRKLFEREKPQVLDRFFEDYFSPKALSSERLMELLEKYEVIDKVGLFFPVLIQELAFLGEKVFYKPRRDQIIKEVSNFIGFLQRYAEREIGEEEIPKNFEGAYCRCGIVIIATALKRQIGDTKPFVAYIGGLVAKKLENIYLVGSAGRQNRAFMDQVSQAIQIQWKLERFMSRAYKAKIRLGGQRIQVDNYLILHRNPETVRYVDKEYQDQFLES